MSIGKNTFKRNVQQAQTGTQTPGWWTAFQVVLAAGVIIAVLWTAFKPSATPAATTVGPGLSASEQTQIQAAEEGTSSTPASADPVATTTPTNPTPQDSTTPAPADTVDVVSTDGRSYTIERNVLALATAACKATFDSGAAAGIPWTDPSAAPATLPDPNATVSRIQLAGAPQRASASFIGYITSSGRVSDTPCTRDLVNVEGTWKVVTPQ